MKAKKLLIIVFVSIVCLVVITVVSLTSVIAKGENFKLPINYQVITPSRGIECAVIIHGGKPIGISCYKQI